MIIVKGEVRFGDGEIARLRPELAQCPGDDTASWRGRAPCAAEASTPVSLSACLLSVPGKDPGQRGAKMIRVDVPWASSLPSADRK